MSNQGFERRYDVDDVSVIDVDVLDTVAYDYVGRVTDVTIEYPEFTSVCPWSGLPDFAHLTIRYQPSDRLVELKTLKYYLNSYRNVGIWQEHVVNRILDDLVALLQPHAMEIEARFHVRGGMQTIVKAHYPLRTPEKA